MPKEGIFLNTLLALFNGREHMNLANANILATVEGILCGKKGIIQWNRAGRERPFNEYLLSE